jgi:hypothetical protein
VGHVNHRRFQPLMQIGEFHAHLIAQSRVKIGKGFVEQENVRVADNLTSDRHA